MNSTGCIGRRFAFSRREVPKVISAYVLLAVDKWLLSVAEKVLIR